MQLKEYISKNGILYLASSDGRVFKYDPSSYWETTTYTELNKITKNNGYEAVRIDGKYEYVHRIVAEAFYGEPFEGAQVDHLNAVRNDNRAENLEWVTAKENNRRMRENNGLVGKCKAFQAVTVFWNGRLYDSIAQLARVLDIDPTYVSLAIKYDTKVRGHKVRKAHFEPLPF